MPWPCDICGEPATVRRRLIVPETYVPTVTLDKAAEPMMICIDVDWWHACPECDALIRADDRKALVGRMLPDLLRHAAVLVSLRPRERKRVIAQQRRNLHALVVELLGDTDPTMDPEPIDDDAAEPPQ